MSVDYEIWLEDGPVSLGEASPEDLRQYALGIHRGTDIAIIEDAAALAEALADALEAGAA